MSDGGALNNIEYWEGELPGNCPPDDAVSPEESVLLRLVKSNPVTANDFKSGHADGKTRPNSCDECRWQACSVWLEATDRNKLIALTKLPNLSDKKYVAHVQVDSLSGKVKPHAHDEQHLSFWVFKNFKPEESILEIEEL